MPTVLFFGSFLEHSATILASLVASDRITVVGVVTTPPQPAGRQRLLNKTHVQLLAEQQQLPVYTPATLTPTSLNQLQAHIKNKPDLIVTAGYGKLLSGSWLNFPKLAALNLHFSLLPKYRGANPAEWAILLNESQTGITLIKMSPEFDTGQILAQAAIPLTEKDTRQSVYQKLYELGAQKLPGFLNDYVQGKLLPKPQSSSPTPYAKRLRRQDGFIAWPAMTSVMAGQRFDPQLISAPLQTALFSQNQSPDAHFIERAIRALTGFPGVWTQLPTIKGEKRMKILAASVVKTHDKPKLTLDRVQIEGQAEANWNQVKNNLDKG